MSYRKLQQASDILSGIKISLESHWPLPRTETEQEIVHVLEIVKQMIDEECQHSKDREAARRITEENSNG